MLDAVYDEREELVYTDQEDRRAYKKLLEDRAKHVEGVINNHLEQLAADTKNDYYK